VFVSNLKYNFISKHTEILTQEQGEPKICVEFEVQKE
jgi:hypothetical protein